MASPPSLIDMPTIVFDKILEESDYLAIMSLRKVCHTLRDVIDQTMPDGKFDSINVKLEKERIEFIWSINKLKDTVLFEKRDEGCLLKFSKNEIILENVSFVDVFLEDFEKILKFQKKILKNFEIRCPFCSSETDDGYGKFLEKIQKILEIFPQKVEEFHLDFGTEDHILSILPYLDAQVLRDCTLLESYGTEYECDVTDNVYQLEQWRNCEKMNVVCYGITDINVDAWLHFQDCFIPFHTLETQDLIKIKNAFLQSGSTFKSYQMKWNNFDRGDDFEQLMGPIDPDADDVDNPSSFFRIPNSDLILKIGFEDTYIEFEKVGVSDVYDDKIIQE